MPSGVGARVISIVLEPGGTGRGPDSQPQLKTIRRCGSTLMKRPEAMFCPVTRVRY